MVTIEKFRQVTGVSAEEAIELVSRYIAQGVGSSGRALPVEEMIARWIDEPPPAPQDRRETRRESDV